MARNAKQRKKIQPRIKNGKNVSTGKLGWSEGSRTHSTAKRLSATLVQDEPEEI